MTQTGYIAIIVALFVIILGVAVAAIYRRRRSEQLRNEFGPEYDRALQETGSASRAEATLLQRRKRVERLKLRALTPEDSGRFRDSWSRVQTRFVDDPKGAVTEADQLLGELMSKRGYPVTDFEQRAKDISVFHPRVVENYRAGHEIAQRHARGEASTEDLRQAMIHYRTLFADLLGEKDMTRAKVAEEPVEKERKVI
jgi:hypothetical protein